MRGLTICNPYPALICLPESDPRWKGCENRTWQTSYRGPLAIHAGLSRKWLVNPGGLAYEEDYGLAIAEMVFGAVVAVVDLADCVYVPRFKGEAWRRPSVNVGDRDRYPWLQGHPHLEGPYAWILRDVRPLPAPIPWRGSQGLWAVPDELAAKVQDQLSPAEARS